MDLLPRFLKVGEARDPSVELVSPSHIVKRGNPRKWEEINNCSWQEAKNYYECETKKSLEMLGKDNGPGGKLSNDEEKK